jgi:dephospho-CoA kinase
MIIGLTGGIACGKSTVGAMLAARGALLVDADQAARDVVLPGMPALEEVAAEFGHGILQADGTLDRAKLGTLVFADKDKLRKLESILHPAIRSFMWERMNEAQAADPDKLIVADIPLLYETEQQSLYEGVLVVYIPRAMQLDRLLQRNPAMGAEQANQRINVQMDIERKRELADWVIDNSGTIEQTQQQVESFLDELRHR